MKSQLNANAEANANANPIANANANAKANPNAIANGNEPAKTSPPTPVGAGVHVPARHLGPLIALVIASTAVFLPMLIKPHWGLFSDAGQIIEDCRMFWDSYGLRFDILAEQYRPGFNIVDKIVWLFSPDQPLGFYISRWLLFAGVVSVTYLNCYSFSRSRLLSFACSCFWFAASPTYEVIYTLDKAEIYIAGLFAVSLFTFFNLSQRLLVDAVPDQVVKRAQAIITFCFVYAIFTKQTGALVLVLSGLFALCALACKKWLVKVFPGTAAYVTVDAFVRQSLFTKALFKRAAFSYAAFFALFLIGGGLKYKYGVTKYGTAHLLAQLKAYFVAVPEVYALLVVCLLAIVIMPKLRRHAVEQEPFKYGYAICLTLSCIAGALALFSWVGNLTYGWFPLYTLLLPAAAYFMSALFCIGRKSTVAVVAVLCTMLVALIPNRAVEAQLQYKMDESAKQLTVALSALPHDDAHPLRLIMPFTDPGRTEVGERIESLTLNRLVPHYIERRPSDAVPVKMFNIVEYCGPKGLLGAPDLKHYTNFVDATKCADYKPSPGLDVFSYWSDTGWRASHHWPQDTLKAGDIFAHHWYQDKLKVGDVFVHPFGDVPVNATFYRGISLFTTDWHDEMRFMPQVTVEPILTVTQAIRRPGQPRVHIGWVALKIVHIDPIAWPISHDGWLMQNAWVSLDRSLCGRVLHIETRLGFPHTIKVRHGTDTETITAKPGPDGVLNFDIPINAPNGQKIDVKTIQNSDPVLFLSSDDPTKGTDDMRPLMLHVDKVSVLPSR
jgi:hypothetical protein